MQNGKSPIHTPKPKFAFLCDGKDCKECNETCKHTLNIEHAKNFKRVGDYYIEQERS